jgi:hypothetical protein
VRLRQRNGKMQLKRWFKENTFESKQFKSRNRSKMETLAARFEKQKVVALPIHSKR